VCGMVFSSANSLVEDGVDIFARVVATALADRRHKPNSIIGSDMQSALRLTTED